MPFFAQQIGRTSIPFQFSEDVIQEFQVTSNGFEAEFGQAGGGLVNSVTRSGTNDLHGDAYYYILDSALNANDPITKSLDIAKPPNRRQQFGGTVGGPVKRDPIFFIANYDGQIRNEPITVNNAAAFVGLPAGFLAANPGIAAQVTAASGSFARSFNQNAAFGKVNIVFNNKNTLDGTYNYQRYRSPHGYFNTPTSNTSASKFATIRTRAEASQKISGTLLPLARCRGLPCRVYSSPKPPDEVKRLNYRIRKSSSSRTLRC